MPARSNVFQDVIGILQRHFAQGAQVQESAMLTDKVIGIEREVDVVVTGSDAGRQVVVSVEATSHGRKATIEWVERMICKHADLPTNQLVLVSESGFTPEAKRKADAKGVTVLTPEAIDDGEADGAVAKGLASVWAKRVATTPYNVVLELERDEPADFQPQPDTPVLLADGAVVGSIAELATASVQSRLREVTEDVMRQVDRDGFVTLDFRSEFEEATDPAEGVVGGFHVDDGVGVRRIRAVRLLLVCEVVVREVPLSHRRLDTVPYASGVIDMPDEDLVIVVTEHQGTRRLTLKPRPKKSAGPKKGAAKA